MISWHARADGDRRLDIGLLADDSTTLRTSRTTRGISAIAIAMMTFSRLACVSAISAIASRIDGIAIIPSITRMTTRRPAAMKPHDQADQQRRSAVATSATARPTISDTRAP